MPDDQSRRLKAIADAIHLHGKVTIASASGLTAEDRQQIAERLKYLTELDEMLLAEPEPEGREPMTDDPCRRLEFLERQYVELLALTVAQQQTIDELREELRRLEKNQRRRGG